MNTMIARDSVGHPVLGVIQHEGIDGPETLCGAYMLSWMCFCAVRDTKLTVAEDVASYVRNTLEGDEWHKRLKQTHFESVLRIRMTEEPMENMPVHPTPFLIEVAGNHIAAARHFGYLGLNAE